METINQAVIIGFLLALANFDVSASCDEGILANCTNSGPQNSPPFSYLPTQLPAACSNISEMLNCSLTSANCPTTTTATSLVTMDYAALVAGYNDLCSTSGQASYTLYQSCISTAIASTAFTFCGNQSKAQFPAGSSNNPSATTMNCVLYNNMVACYVYAVQQTCTASIAFGAATFAQKIMLDIIAPSVAYLDPSCTLNGATSIVNITIFNQATTLSTTVTHRAGTPASACTSVALVLVSAFVALML